MQQVEHTRGVVLVHLATMGFDKYFLRHKLVLLRLEYLVWQGDLPEMRADYSGIGKNSLEKSLLMPKVVTLPLKSEKKA